MTKCRTEARLLPPIPSVILIDPATRHANGWQSNVVTIPGQGVYTYNPCYRRFDLDPFDGFTHRSYTNQLYPYRNIDRLTESCPLDNYILNNHQFANDDSSLGNTVGTNANRKPAYQRPIVGWQSGYYNQHLCCID